MRVNEYLTSGEAANLLGISKITLKNWHTTGKLIAHVNPITRFRLYRLVDINNIIEKLNSIEKKITPPPPTTQERLNNLELLCKNLTEKLEKLTRKVDIHTSKSHI